MWPIPQHHHWVGGGQLAVATGFTIVARGGGSPRLARAIKRYQGYVTAALVPPPQRTAAAPGRQPVTALTLSVASPGSERLDSRTDYSYTLQVAADSAGAYPQIIT